MTDKLSTNKQFLFILFFIQRVEAAELEEEAQGARITVKKKKGGKGKASVRQTKLASGAEKNSLVVTKPSPFAEAIDPIIPEFNANPKKAGSGRKRGVKAEPAGAADTSLKDESNEGDDMTETTAKKPKVVESLDILGVGVSKKTDKPAATVKTAVSGAAAGPVKKKAKAKLIMDDDSLEIEDSDDMDVRTHNISGFV